MNHNARTPIALLFRLLLVPYSELALLETTPQPTACTLNDGLKQEFRSSSVIQRYAIRETSLIGGLSFMSIRHE